MAFKYMPVYVFYVFVFNVEQSGKQIPIVLFKKIILAVQWLRLCLSMQWVRV